MIIAGGLRGGLYVVDFGVDVLPRDLESESTEIRKLPDGIYATSMSLHNETILLCGGKSIEKQCLYLDDGIWEEHSILNKKRIYHASVTTQTATFIFGGKHSLTTYEYLPKDSTEWIMGKTEIPGRGFELGAAIEVRSKQQILLIGGHGTSQRILIFNVNDHTFQELPLQLMVGRSGHRCAFIPNTKKIMIAGGYSRSTKGNRFENSTVILDTENNRVTKGSMMNTKRRDHGMGIVTINGEEKLAVFGGQNVWHTWLDTVEVYNTKAKKWENTDIKLNVPKSHFGYLNVKRKDIISKL